MQGRYNDDLLEINSITVYSNYYLYPYISCSLLKPINIGMTFDILAEQGANDYEEVALQLRYVRCLNNAI